MPPGPQTVRSCRALTSSRRAASHSMTRPLLQPAHSMRLSLLMATELMLSANLQHRATYG